MFDENARAGPHFSAIDGVIGAGPDAGVAGRAGQFANACDLRLAEQVIGRQR